MSWCRHHLVILLCNDVTALHPLTFHSILYILCVKSSCRAPGPAEPVRLVRPKPDHYFVRPKPGILVFYLQSTLWVNHTLHWSLETMLLVTKNVDSANARTRWTPPSKRAGFGSVLYTRNSLELANCANA